MPEHSIESIVAAETDETWANLLVDRLFPLYHWFDGNASLEDARRRFFGRPSNVIDLVRYKGDIVGFAITRTYNTPDKRLALYRGGTLIDPKYQSHGFYLELIKLALERSNPHYIVTRTQNPRVYESLSYFSGCGYDYPNPVLAPPTYIIEAAELSDDVELDSDMILRGAYHGLRSEESFKKTKQAWIEGFFADKLGPDDAFVMVVPMQNSPGGF